MISRPRDLCARLSTVDPGAPFRTATARIVPGFGQPEYPRPGHCGQQTAGAGIDAHESLGPRDPHEPGAFRRSCGTGGSQRGMTVQLGAQFRTVLAEVALLDVGADPVGVVPIGTCTALDPRWRARRSAVASFWSERSRS